MHCTVAAGLSAADNHLVIDISCQEDDALAQQVIEQVKRHLRHTRQTVGTGQGSGRDRQEGRQGMLEQSTQSSSWPCLEVAWEPAE